MEEADPCSYLESRERDAPETAGRMPALRGSCVGIDFRRPGAGFGGAGPGGSAVFAEGSAEQQDDGKEQSLDGRWRQHRGLRLAVSREHVGEIEQGRPSGLAGVDDGEDGLEETVEVEGRDGASVEPEQFFAGVPPVVHDTRWKHRGASGRQNHLFATDTRAERSGDDGSLLALVVVHVRRRAALVGRQAAFDGQHNFSGGVAHPAQVQDLAGVPVLDRQGIVHGVPRKR